MTLATLERAILAETRAVTGRRALRKKDILAWSNGALTANEGEVLVVLPELALNVVVPVFPAKVRDHAMDPRD